MKPGEAFGRLAAWAARHARAVLAVTAIVAIAAAAGASRLDTNAETDTLVDSDDPAFEATERFHQAFGGEAVVVLVRGDLRRIVLTENLGRLLRLEGCLAGQQAGRGQPLGPACAALARMRPAKVVFGPATFLNQAVIGIEQMLGGQLAEVRAQAVAAARRAVRQAAREGVPQAGQARIAQAAAADVMRGFQERLLRAAAQYGITSIPRLDDPTFVSQVVFDTRRPPGTPKARFAYLFPNRNSALISVRLRPGLSDEQRGRAIELIRSAVFDTRPRRACAVDGEPAPCFELDGARYVVSGVPVVIDGLAETLQRALFVLFGAALVLMAATLLLVFRARMRLLPLALALVAAALTFGLLWLLGGSLTMASIAVLPVLIGLGVDYAIQLQARYDEALAAGAAPRPAMREAARAAAPVVGAACLATAAGFLALLLSPVPMVRGFGLMLFAGVLIAFALSVTAGFAALALRAGGGEPRAPQGPRPPARLRAPVARLGRGRDRAAAAAGRGGRSSLAVAIASPGRVLAVAVALAACGWVAGTRTEVVSDINELVPQDLPAVQDVNELQDATGVAGELNVVVRSDDVTDPELIRWMDDFKQRVLERHGFRGEFPSCADADLCPGTALPDLFTDPGADLTQERVDALLGAIPAYDLQAVVETDPETGEIGDTANISFGIRVMSLGRQHALIEDIRAQIDPPGEPGPPAGTEVELAGVPVLAAESNAALESSRYWLTLAGLAFVALALLAVYRSASRALVPLVPIVLATGWSALVIAAMDVPLNPMSATLGALVIAIATEFSVILAARYHEERAAAKSVGESLRRAYARTGTAVLASGLTAIAGFGALVASDVRMLRDFGFVTVVDLAVALVGVMLVLPAVLVWVEAERAREPRRVPRRLAALLGR